MIGAKWIASSGGVGLAVVWLMAYAAPLVPFRLAVCSGLALAVGVLAGRASKRLF